MTKKDLRRIRRCVTVFLAVAGFCGFLFLSPSSYGNPDLNPLETFLGSFKPEQLPDLKDVQEEADSLLAKDVLENLAVKEKDKSTKYYRKLFYDDWSTTSSGCNMREAILTRDLRETVLKGCKVQSGVLDDPYTGKTIVFQRGPETSSDIQIDHVVALSNAWSTGAFAFDQATRYAISQDPLNLIAVDGPANQEKSDQDAADWLPSNESFQCEYVARQISVKYKYELWVTPQEKQAMRQVLEKCPEEPTLGLEN
jgi:hypothetical protein